MHVVDDSEECEHLETISDTKRYGIAPESYWTLPFALFTVFIGGPSESDSRAVRRQVDADVLADVKNEAAKVEGANAVVLRTTRKTDRSITMEADALFCERFIDYRPGK